VPPPRGTERREQSRRGQRSSSEGQWSRSTERIAVLADLEASPSVLLHSQWVASSSSEAEDTEEEEGYSTEASDDLDLFAASASAAIDPDATAASVLADTQAAQLSPRMENTLDLFVWSIPLSALFVLLDIMIQDQYAMHPTALQEMGRMIGTVPVLFAVVWFSK
jgi:hypothetical protein